MVTCDDVKWRLGEVRYISKFERNLLSLGLGRFEAKRRSIKASGG